MSRGELTTDLELDNEVYTMSSTLTARLNIRNSTGDPSSPGILSFSTSQMYDLEIRDGNGQVVALWSRGKTFAQIVTELEIEDHKEFVVTLPLAKLPRGHYVAQGWFTAEGPARAFSASARFQIQ